MGKKCFSTPQMILILYRVSCLLLVLWSQGRVLAAMVNKKDSVEAVSITGYSPYDRFCHLKKNKVNSFLLILISVYSHLQSQNADVATGRQVLPFF